MITDRRINYKPFEYPEVMSFIEAINKSFWVHSEVDFTADIQDFHSSLSESEREAFKRALLAISQVEVAVKTFWGNLYNHFPKPEINGLGSTFAECEFRHSEAYSRMLEVLGYNNEFEKLLQIPAFKDKQVLLEKYMAENKSIEDKILFFTLITENGSLFSQFAIILSFTRFKGLMKNTSNIIAWTSIDEQIHANAGMWLLNQMQKENPVDNAVRTEKIHSFIQDYIKTEINLLNWIFEMGEFDTISKADLVNFIKYRIDESLVNIGIEQTFNIPKLAIKPMEWFDEEIYANNLDDFFAKRPVDYTKHDKSITADDLF